ncbi:MAG TPA: hypothetical protein VJ872_12855 [Nocardioides sp.]|nr:hypothetical protein [Nocardioides sp.]
MRTVRALLIGAGALLMAYAAWLLVRDQTAPQLVQVGEWAAAAVVVHDAVLAPLTLAVGWLVQGRLPASAARAVAIALTLVGTVAIAAFAVLTRSHQGGSNGTLLDRDYPIGLLAVTLVVIGTVAVTAAVAPAVHRLRRSRGWRG